MTNYARMYRLGMTPWEKYGPAAAASISAVRRGWEAVGVDYVPAAVEAARSRGTEGVTYLVAAITGLTETDLGRFGFFLDIGCFQGLDAGQRRAAGATVSALAEPGATILMLAFGPSRYRSLVGGVSQSEVSAAFTGWEMLTAEPADTAGLSWPMNRTAPQWYRLRH